MSFGFLIFVVIVLTAPVVLLLFLLMSVLRHEVLMVGSKPITVICTIRLCSLADGRFLYPKDGDSLQSEAPRTTINNIYHSSEDLKIWIFIATSNLI
jgi:hypothetical protein